jgi:hypothetical protein
MPPPVPVGYVGTENVIQPISAGLLDRTELTSTNRLFDETNGIDEVPPTKLE